MFCFQLFPPPVACCHRPPQYNNWPPQGEGDNPPGPYESCFEGLIGSGCIAGLALLDARGSPLYENCVDERLLPLGGGGGGGGRLVSPAEGKQLVSAGRGVHPPPLHLTLHATSPSTSYGAPRVVHAMSPWSVKTRRAPSQYCADTRVYGPVVRTTGTTNEYTHPPSSHLHPTLVLTSWSKDVMLRFFFGSI